MQLLDLLDTTPTQVGGASGAVSVTLAADEADATRIARLGATGRLVLVGLPAGSTTPFKRVLLAGS